MGSSARVEVMEAPHDRARGPGPVPLAARALGVVLAVGWAMPGAAWLWPEHRDITAAAVADLDPSRHRALEAMWNDAYLGGTRQLCPDLVDVAASPTSGEQACVDFASWPAFAGDHACSSADLWETVTARAWAARVVVAGERSRERLAAAKDEAEREDAWNLAHIDMQSADTKYMSRATGNDAHFLLPYASGEGGEALGTYLARSLDPAQPINATGLYAEYHEVALRLAVLSRSAAPPARPELARRALLSEAIALHFLEDSFAAGHISTWGDAAWRKGTHDLYSERGIRSATWRGERFESHGDAHMTGHDMRVAAETVRLSLAQLVAAGDGKPAASGALSPAESRIEALDFCQAAHLPPAPADPGLRAESVDVLLGTPEPAGGPDGIYPPRQRAEVGLFFGLAASFQLGLAFGGYETTGGVRQSGALAVGVRFGYGLEGLLTSAMDGQFWVEAAFVAEPYQLDLSCPGCPGGKRTTPQVPRVPSRFPMEFAVRMPYYLVPGDLVILAPVLVLFAPDALQSVVLTAAYGGLLGLQRRVPTGIGSFQFVLGREVGFTVYGPSTNTFVSYEAPPDPGSPYALVQYRSWALDLPVLEVQPPRVFQTTLSLTVNLQLGFSAEFTSDSTLSQQGSTPYQGLGTSYIGYLRVVFDARKY